MSLVCQTQVSFHLFSPTNISNVCTSKSLAKRKLFIQITTNAINVIIALSIYTKYNHNYALLFYGTFKMKAPKIKTIVIFVCTKKNFFFMQKQFFFKQKHFFIQKFFFAKAISCRIKIGFKKKCQRLKTKNVLKLTSC